MTRPRLLAVISCAAIAALALAVGLNPLSNNDIWLHLTTGRLILERGAPPQVDEYSFTRSGSPYVAHEWLAQVVFFLIHKLAGFAGLIALKPAAVWITAALVFATSRRLGAGSVASLWGAGLCLASMTSHLFVRPHLFTFILVAATFLLLSRPREMRWGSLMLLLALQILWANVHGGFVLGILTAAALGVWMPAAGMALVSLVNPYGTALFRFVLTFTDPVFRSRIREWASPFQEPFVGSFHFYVYAAVLLMALVAAGRHAAKRRFGAVAAICLFTVLSLLSKRNASLLGVAAAPWIALAATELAGSRWEARRGQQALALSCAVVFLLAIAAAIFGVPHETGRGRRIGTGLGDNVPVAALDYVTSQGIRGDALTSLGFGSYVTYRCFPASRVFIDSRLDVYGGRFIDEFSEAMADAGRMRELLRRHPANYAVLSYRIEEVEGAVAALTSDPGWALVYYDDISLVYVRRLAPWEDLIRRDEYVRTNPYLFLSGRQSFVVDAAQAAAEADRALAISADSLVARLMKATALQALGRHREAIELLEKMAGKLREDPAAQVILLGLLGTSHMELKEDGRAVEAFEDLLVASPGSVYARRMLEELRSRR